MLCTRVFTRMPSVKNTLPVISQLHATCSSITQPYNYNRGPLAEQARWLHATGRHYCTTGATTGVVNGQQKQEQQPSDGILKRMLNKVGLTPNIRTRLKVCSHSLYENVADKVNYFTFFRDFELPNTFNSWFLVTELHVWMLMVRSMAEGAESGEDGRFLRNCIVEVMWSDVNQRAKKLGGNNPSRTRQQIEELSEQFQAALIAYDEGIMSNDRVLAAAVWRRFFAMDCEDFAKIERLVKYVRVQINMLDQLSREEFLIRPKIPWVDLEKITCGSTA